MLVTRPVAPVSWLIRRGITQNYRASPPFIALEVIVMAVLTAFPSVALWLPGLLR